MKHLFIFLFITISAMSFAQGNLQFNKVVSFNGTISSPSVRIPLDTVAAGKVIKVTSLNRGNNYIQITINNQAAIYGSSITEYNFPVWLKEGDMLGIASGWNGTYSYHVSGIEFNIIP